MQPGQSPRRAFHRPHSGPFFLPTSAEPQTRSVTVTRVVCPGSDLLLRGPRRRQARVLGVLEVSVGAARVVMSGRTCVASLSSSWKSRSSRSSLVPRLGPAGRRACHLRWSSRKISTNPGIRAWEAPAPRERLSREHHLRARAREHRARHPRQGPPFSREARRAGSLRAPLTGAARPVGSWRSRSARRPVSATAIPPAWRIRPRAVLRRIKPQITLDTLRNALQAYMGLALQTATSPVASVEVRRRL